MVIGKQGKSVSAGFLLLDFSKKITRKTIKN